MREAPHQTDRQQGARERRERDDDRARAERDGEDRAERCARLRTGDERIRERIPQESLEQHPGGGERASDEDRSEHARQSQLADDRAVGVVAAEEGREDATWFDGHRPDEHGRGRAHQERGREHGHHDSGSHYCVAEGAAARWSGTAKRGMTFYLKSSGWTMRAYASAASPTRGPGRLIRFGAIVPMRLFF